MPRPVATEDAARRRARLGALIEALGAARGAKVTQREFAASIGREQGTIAAILGGHRALGGDVMLAVVQAYGLPADYFDSALAPNPRPFARAAVGAVPALRGEATGPGPLRAPPVSVAYGSRDPGLAEVIAALAPDRAVAMALESLSRRGMARDSDGWSLLAIEAQSAHDRGALGGWFAEAQRLPLAQPEVSARGRSSKTKRVGAV